MKTSSSHNYDKLMATIQPFIEKLVQLGYVTPQEQQNQTQSLYNYVKNDAYLTDQYSYDGELRIVTKTKPGTVMSSIFKLSIDPWGEKVHEKKSHLPVTMYHIPIRLSTNKSRLQQLKCSVYWNVSVTLLKMNYPEKHPLHNKNRVV
ncbi:hypothetical protein SAMN05421788_110176 [Filimonas lacunae]|uniref:Uncharacterized protein n=1 Tax=Filimonas lacunae TaxID=477680 RepID=A0A1N7R8L0_9BACT|nr:hypothetical protein [Filimonas lacunae]SIT31451.1 hypothetical protein SAMN05421788_110176 [Filimonas lacunae]